MVIFMKSQDFFKKIIQEKMATKSVILAGENPLAYGPQIVGGKGYNLMGLYNFARDTGMVNVPDFFVVPTNAEKHYLSTPAGLRVAFLDDTREHFERLKKPVIARSSYPLEDSVKATFAGMFDSYPSINDYDKFCQVSAWINEGTSNRSVQKYARNMGVALSLQMAIIAQEEVKEYSERGTIKLEENRAVIDVLRKDLSRHQIVVEYGNLNEFLRRGYIKKPTESPHPHEFIDEVEWNYAVNCAREAKKRLNLDGTVQVEYLLAPNMLPNFVQVRQLPAVSPPGIEIDLGIPKGAVYLESEVCNDVPGELILPAYVTLSHSGVKGVLLATGQSFWVGIQRDDAALFELFHTKSRFAKNMDLETFRNFVMHERSVTMSEMMPHYKAAWARGNSLFPEYILVCDKLDDTLVTMTDETTNKRGIITCNEADAASHSMTIARDLGIPAMGVSGNLRDMSHFYHQVETGDTIHMKSNGRKAVAFIKERRQSDPYTKLMQE